MIRVDGITYTYPGAAAPALDGIDLTLPEGELVIVAGRTGAGKSTLLRLFNGLVPHYSGGTIAGTVAIDGRVVGARPPREMADLVGFVPQDPWAHAVADRVEAELAFAMENLGTAPARMRKRIEEVLDQFGIAALRERRLDTLSGGERQRVAIAAVLTALPRVLVCDEPTSSLDPGAAEDVLSMLVRLRDEIGMTIVCSEHRLDRVAAFADRVVWMSPQGLVDGTPREVLPQLAHPPPVVELARHLNWTPMPLTVREARAHARGLALEPPAHTPVTPGAVVCSAGPLRSEVLRDVSLDVRAGEVTAIVGRNGAGKTTLLRALAGLVKAGRVERGPVAYLPQRAEALLFHDTVRAQVADDHWLAELSLAPLADRHPWDLSAGQQLRVALATVFAQPADLLLLDEPTRGLDAETKRLLVRLMRSRGGVVFVTHDVELVAAAADRVILMADGAIAADGQTAEILGESLLFSSQTSKVMGDPRFLVPEDVAR